MDGIRDSMETAYSMPQLAPAYPKCPIEAQVDATIASYEIDEDVYQSVIPAPLEPLDRPLCHIWAMRYDSVGYGNYDELLVLLIARYKDELVSFAPLLYLNSGGSTGIAAGREIWGAPKVAVDNVTFEERGKEAAWTFGHGQTDQMVLSVTEERVVKDHDKLPVDEDKGMKMVSWKQIPSSVKGAPPAVNRIVVSEVPGVSINQGTSGRAQFDVTRTADKPIHLFEPQTEPEGYRIDMDIVLDTSEDAILRVMEEHNPS